MPPPEEIGEKLDNLRSPEWNFKTPGGLNMFSPLKRFVVQREKGGCSNQNSLVCLAQPARSQTPGLSYSCEFGLIPIVCTKSHSVGGGGLSRRASCNTCVHPSFHFSHSVGGESTVEGVLVARYGSNALPHVGHTQRADRGPSLQARVRRCLPL